MVVETKKILDPKIKVHRDLRARAGVRRPFGSDQHRVRERDLGRSRRRRSCARRRASCWSTSARTADTSRRSNASATMRPSSAACARIRPSTTACRCGASRDNLRKGAALNAVQIAELLGRRHLQEGGVMALTGGCQCGAVPLHAGGRGDAAGLLLPLPHLSELVGQRLQRAGCRARGCDRGDGADHRLCLPEPERLDVVSASLRDLSYAPLEHEQRPAGDRGRARGHAGCERYAGAARAYLGETQAALDRDCGRRADIRGDPRRPRNSRRS